MLSHRRPSTAAAATAAAAVHINPSLMASDETKVYTVEEEVEPFTVDGSRPVQSGLLPPLPPAPSTGVKPVKRSPSTARSMYPVPATDAVAVVHPSRRCSFKWDLLVCMCFALIVFISYDVIVVYHAEHCYALPLVDAVGEKTAILAALDATIALRDRRIVEISALITQYNDYLDDLRTRISRLRTDALASMGESINGLPD